MGCGWFLASWCQRCGSLDTDGRLYMVVGRLRIVPTTMIMTANHAVEISVADNVAGEKS